MILFLQIFLELKWFHNALLFPPQNVVSQWRRIGKVSMLLPKKDCESCKCKCSLVCKYTDSCWFHQVVRIIPVRYIFEYFNVASSYSAANPQAKTTVKRRHKHARVKVGSRWGGPWECHSLTVYPHILSHWPISTQSYVTRVIVFYPYQLLLNILVRQSKCWRTNLNYEWIILLGSHGFVQSCRRWE